MGLEHCRPISRWVLKHFSLKLVLASQDNPPLTRRLDSKPVVTLLLVRVPVAQHAYLVTMFFILLRFLGRNHLGGRNSFHFSLATPLSQTHFAQLSA